MAITLVGVGSAVTGTADIAPPYPAAYTAVAGDVAVVHWNETVADTGEFTTPTGWTKVATILNEVGANDGRSSVYLKVLTASESMPTWGGDTVDQVIAFCEIWRGVDTTTPQDATAVTSEANNTLTFTPTGITTVTAGAVVISSVGCPFNGGDIAITTANSFTLSHQDGTTNGANVTVGSAYRTVATAGAVSSPVWEKTEFTAIGQWCGITLALRPSTATDANISASVVTATGAAVAPTTVSAGSSVTATAVTATGAGIAPTASAGSTITSGVITATGAAIAPATVSANSNANITANVVTATGAAIAPSVSAGGGADITATTVTATGATLAPTVSAGVTVSATVVTATGAAVAPTASAGSTITSGVVTATGAAIAPTVSSGSTVSATVVTATGAGIAPSVTAGGGANITATVVTATGSVIAPTASAGATVSATVVTAAGAALNPSVTAGFSASVTASTVTAVAYVLPPDTVSSGATVPWPHGTRPVRGVTRRPLVGVTAGATVGRTPAPTIGGPS